MSLITRCPACNTMFKVVADQLRISEGWVRCGQCNEIFDASAQLQEAAAPSKTKPRKTVQPGPEVERKTLAGPAQKRAAEKGFASTAGQAPYNSHESDSGDGFPPTESLLSGTDETPAPPQPLPPLPQQPEVAVKELSFMRRSKPESRWHRPLVRFTLLMLSLLLGVSLLLQWVVQERNKLAAVEPSLKPWIEEVCNFAHCSLSPLRQIDAIVIDSSAFNKVRGDVYRLNFTLKNTSSMALAQPAIELSVTDVHNMPIMRRIFSPDEIGTRSGILPASSESSSSLTLGIKTSNPSERIAGYRILAFYP
jgi:predicted Zn finger-like uncharacterized protein